jgi:hypothetical protein
MGKILAGLNLVFSLITGWLIIMVFVTRTNWSEGYERMKRDVETASQTLETTKRQYDERIAEKTKEVDRATTDLKKIRDDLVTAEALKDEAQKKLRDFAQLKDQGDVIIAKLTSEREVLLTEIKGLDSRLKERQDKVLELEQKTREYQAKAIKFEIDYMSAQDRNEKLVNRLTELTKEMEHLRGERAEQAATLQRNPPPEDVKGKVMATDQQSGYVTINLGSDNGLTKGNTLEVFRRQPRPQYVGVLRILEVRPHEAVGRLVQRTANVQAGDEVASEILGRR